MIERIAIIDHDNHALFVEDIDIDVLESKYNGEEEDYIRDNYACFSGNFSWDYIVDTCYTPISGNSTTIEWEDEFGD